MKIIIIIIFIIFLCGCSSSPQNTRCVKMDGEIKIIDGACLYGKADLQLSADWKDIMKEVVFVIKKSSPQQTNKTYLQMSQEYSGKYFKNATFESIELWPYPGGAYVMLNFSTEAVTESVNPKKMEEMKKGVPKLKIQWIVARSLFSAPDEPNDYRVSSDSYFAEEILKSLK